MVAGAFNGYAPVTESCLTACTAGQAEATMDGRGADFQALLTCVGNAGSFAPVCASLACGLTDAFGAPTECTAAAAASGASTPDAGP